MPNTSSSQSSFSSTMRARNQCPVAAARKVAELDQLEQRLQAASNRAQDAGDAQRAEAYSRQMKAVRKERQTWLLLAQTPSAPAPAPHLLAAGIAVLVPFMDLFVAGGVAARRLSRVVLTIGLVACAVVLGTSPPSAWAANAKTADEITPAPWAKEIAARELSRKGSVRILPAHPLTGRMLTSQGR